MQPERTLPLVIALGLLALALRLQGLDADSMFMDEIHQFTFYTGSLADAFNGSARQQQPPLDYLLGFLVYQVNQGDFALRLPAALFGTGSVMLIIALADRCLRSCGTGDYPRWHPL